MIISDMLGKYRHIVIQDNISPDGGGIQNIAFNLAVQLKRRGLAVAAAGKIDPSTFQDAGIDVVSLKKPFRSKHTSDLRLLLLLLRLRKKYGSNVILYSLLINNIKIYRWLQPFLGWKCVSFLHGNEILRLSRKRKTTLDHNIRSCLRVIANSRFTKDFLRKIGDYPNIVVVNPGISIELFTGYAGPDYREKEHLGHRKIILMLSRLARRKGHQTVIRAVSSLLPRHPEILLLIAGKGKYRQEIEGMIEEAGIENHARILGAVGQEEKLALYQACDVYCMPSEVSQEQYEVEGFGITFLEAAAMGKITIGSDSGGIPDAIEDGRSGFLIEPGDDRELARILDGILSDPGRYKSMGEYARERAAANFSWDGQVEKILKSIEESLS